MVMTRRSGRNSRENVLISEKLLKRLNAENIRVRKLVNAA